MDAEQPVSWVAIAPGATVIDNDGSNVGHVDAVLGDDEDDIFHGIALNLRGPAGVIELPAARVTLITANVIHTDLGPGEARSLPRFHEDHWFEFEGVSRFFKRAKWRRE